MPSLIEAFFPLFEKHNVDCILIGGWAATAHGSLRSTVDINFVYSRTSDNLDRLVTALAPHHPYLRGAPSGLPFVFDQATLRAGLNFTLTTDIGDIDLLGEVTGGGDYHRLLPFSVQLEVLGFTCRCVTLEKLIQLKRAAGRPKDFEAIAELEALREEREAR